MRVTLDETDGAVREHVGQVLVDLHDFVAVHDRARTVAAVADDRRPPGRARLGRGGLAARPAMGVRIVGIDVARAAAQMAEELVEAAPQRVVLLAEPEMPLPHQTGDVAGLPHQVAERRLVLGQSQLGVGVPLVVRGRVVLVAEPVLVTAREDPGPHRTADRRRDVAVGQPDPVRRQLVDVRRRDDGRSVGADVAVAEVVGEDDDHVGRRGHGVLSRLGFGAAAGNQNGQDD